MQTRRWIWIVWPAFLMAAIMELVVFAFVDPLNVQWLGSSLEWSRSAIYTAAFFAFWLVSIIGALMTTVLGRSAHDLNGGIVSEPRVESVQ